MITGQAILMCTQKLTADRSELNLTTRNQQLKMWKTEELCTKQAICERTDNAHDDELSPMLIISNKNLQLLNWMHFKNSSNINYFKILTSSIATKDFTLQ